MIRSWHRRALVAALLLLGLTAASARAVTINPTLTVQYSNGSIVLLDSGTPMAAGTTIPAGVYDLVFDIVSGEPAIQLNGPGVSVYYTEDGDADWDEVQTLVPGSTYTVHDNRAGAPTLAFSTTNTPVALPPAAPPPTGAPVSNGSVLGSKNAATRGTLTASLGTAAAPTLTENGKAVSRLAAGRYVFALRDRTAALGLELQEQGGRTVSLSGRAFVGTRRVAVVLAAGRWTLRAGAGAGRSFVVSG